MEKGVVYICHHIDTEGPLWEVISELFNRLKLIFGIDLEPTYENLEKLQNGEIEVPEEIKESLALTVDPHTVGFKRNWGMIEEMLYRIMSPEFRNKMKDSLGGGWIYNWQKNNWKTADKKPVKNKEIWQEIYNLTKIHKVKFIKVKGHADNEFNNRCDELARNAIKTL